MLRGTLQLLYGIYSWLAFGIIAFIALLALLVVPGLERRRSIARFAARLWMRVSGLRLTLKSADLIPGEQCVIVSNHSSYLDGVVFTAALPPRFGFVIKREMAAVPLAGMLLKRIGSEFVERFDRRKGASDARRVMRTAAEGSSLVFFPEGTFTPEHGLLKFHPGAFVTAAKAGCPVAPAVIRGTRDALPAGEILPRPGQIEIEFLPPLRSSSDAPSTAASTLRDTARDMIAQALGESGASDPAV